MKLSFRRRVTLALSLTAFLTAGFPAAGTTFAADEPDAQPTFVKALKNGDFNVALRYRFESVSDDAPVFRGNDGNASTLRSTLTWRTADWRHARLLVQVEDVSDLGLGDQHNNAGAENLANGVTGRPVVADPDGTEINQVHVRYGGLPETRITVGRQLVTLGNLRYIGNVGWRQNHQTFDAVRIDQDSIPLTKLTYVFAGNANRITGANAEMQSHFLTAEVAVDPVGRVLPYLYRLDYDDRALWTLSTSTIGVAVDGRWSPLEAWSFPWRVEGAVQRDTADNPAEVDAGYRRIEIGADRERLGIRLGVEVLGGSPSEGRFTTPLATLHAFNGWTDKFLVTPARGLEDRYLSVKGAIGEVALTLVLHEFSADFGSLDYGTETDFQASWKAPWEQTFAVKAAFYDADRFAFDTRKLMAWTTYAF